jgi:colicin import membrane protein
MRENWFLTSKSFLLSAALHLVLGAILLFSFEFSADITPPPKPAVNIVKAVVVDKSQIDKELNRLKEKADKKKTDELKRQKDLEKREQEIKDKLKKEEKKLKDIKKKKEQEQKKIKEEKLRLKKLKKEKKELEKKQKLEKEKKKKAEEEKKKLAAEKKNQEEELKKKEAEKKKLAEEKKKADEEKKRKEQKQALQDELDAELAAEQAAEQERQDAKEIDRYTRAIARSIESKFNQLGLEEGLSCVILIRMIEGGKVVEASIVKSSGNELFDKRAETAVYSASPLPAPDEARLFEQMRNIRFTFEP